MSDKAAAAIHPVEAWLSESDAGVVFGTHDPATGALAWGIWCRSEGITPGDPQLWPENTHDLWAAAEKRWGTPDVDLREEPTWQENWISDTAQPGWTPYLAIAF